MQGLIASFDLSNQELTSWSFHYLVKSLSIFFVPCTGMERFFFLGLSLGSRKFRNYMVGIKWIEARLNDGVI